MQTRNWQTIRGQQHFIKLQKWVIKEVLITFQWTSILFAIWYFQATFILSSCYWMITLILIRKITMDSPLFLWHLKMVSLNRNSFYFLRESGLFVNRSLFLYFLANLFIDEFLHWNYVEIPYRSLWNRKAIKTTS